MSDNNYALSSKKQGRSLKKIKLLLLLILIGGLAWLGVSYLKTRNELKHAQNNPIQKANQEVDSLINKIGTHLELPQEKPTIATVEDTKKLANQPFFKSAQKGDKVLIFAKTKKAVIYRPSTDKIIEVANLSIKN